MKIKLHFFFLSQKKIYNIVFVGGLPIVVLVRPVFNVKDQK